MLQSGASRPPDMLQWPVMEYVTFLLAPLITEDEGEGGGEEKGWGGEEEGWGGEEEGWGGEEEG